MARQNWLSIIVVFLIIDSTLQYRHGFSSELLHVYEESNQGNTPAVIQPVALGSFSQILRKKRETGKDNDDTPLKSTLNIGKVPSLESSIPEKNTKNNSAKISTMQTTNNITTMVRKYIFYLLFLNVNLILHLLIHSNLNTRDFKRRDDHIDKQCVIKTIYEKKMIKKITMGLKFKKNQHKLCDAIL